MEDSVNDVIIITIERPNSPTYRLAIGWAVRAPFPSGLTLHPEVRFAWELGWPP